MSEKFDHPLEAVPEIVNFLLALFGLYQIWQTVYDHTHNYKLALVSIVFVLIPISFPFIRWVQRPDLYKLYGLSVQRRAVITSSLHDVSVGDDGIALASTTRTIVFLEKPKTGDLRDIFEFSEALPPTQFNYESPDAAEIKRVRIGKQRLAIYWIPKSFPGRNQQYEHSVSWKGLGYFFDPGNYFVALADMPTGIYRLRLRTKKPIHYALAFRKPRRLNFSTEAQIYHHALDLTELDCPQPRVDGGRLELEVPDLRLGEMIYCVFFYEGGVEFWKKRIDSPAPSRL